MDAEHWRALFDWKALAVSIPVSLVIITGVIFFTRKWIKKHRGKEK